MLLLLTPHTLKMFAMTYCKYLKRNRIVQSILELRNISRLSFFFFLNLFSNELGTTCCAHLSSYTSHFTLKMFVMTKVLKKKSYDTKYLRITIRLIQMSKKNSLNFNRKVGSIRWREIWVE